MDDSNDNESSQEAITPLDREQMKKEITQSLSAVEAKKQRAAERKRKLQEDYQKNRDPIKEFFTLVSLPIQFETILANIVYTYRLANRLKSIVHT